MKKLLLPFIVILIFAGCTEKNYPEPSSFVFGGYQGMCFENCVHVFKLETGKLYPNEMSTRFKLDDVNFQTTPLDDKWAKKTEELYRLFPSYLRKNPNISIGCPDCSDQGVIYLAFEENGKVTEWKIDPDMNDFPPEIEAFMIAMKELISELPR